MENSMEMGSFGRDDEDQKYKITDLTGLKVLFAEDMIMNQMLIKLHLENLKASCVCSNNGKELYETYKKAPDQYHVIITDIHMPELDGTEAITKIRQFEEEKNLDAIPVIFLTGNEDEAEKKKFVFSFVNLVFQVFEYGRKYQRTGLFEQAIEIRGILIRSPQRFLPQGQTKRTDPNLPKIHSLTSIDRI